MTRNIILSSCAIIFAGFFFVINDAIINFLSSINIQFYHLFSQDSLWIKCVQQIIGFH